jgi:CheY-like chemotaxis protein
MIADILTAEGLNIATAKDGFQGLQLAKEIHPHLILCNIYLPKLNGYGVLRQLQQDMMTCNIPLIFFTAESYLNNQLLTSELETYGLAAKVEETDLLKILAYQLKRQFNRQETSELVEHWLIRFPPHESSLRDCSPSSNVPST